MIKKALLLFGFLGIVYTALIAWFPALSASQNQNQSNYIKAEQYLYETPASRPVTVVGTSLSARLVMDSLQAFSNLSFGGLSLLDGLAIIAKSRHLPDVILVETNFYWKEGSAVFLEPLFSPVNYYLKKYAPSFRSDRQPLAIAANGMISTLKKSRRRPSSNVNAEEVPALQEQVFQDLKKEYAGVPDTAKVQTQLRLLKQKIEQLEARGVRIVFFEMPIHPELTHSVRCHYLRTHFRTVFTPARYAYIPSKEWHFQTTDGIHLALSEARTFSRYLQEWYTQDVTVSRSASAQGLRSF